LMVDIHLYLCLMHDMSTWLTCIASTV